MLKLLSKVLIPLFLCTHSTQTINHKSSLLKDNQNTDHYTTAIIFDSKMNCVNCKTEQQLFYFLKHVIKYDHKQLRQYLATLKQQSPQQLQCALRHVVCTHKHPISYQ